MKDELVKKAETVNGVKVVKAIVNMPADAVKNIVFQLRGEFTEGMLIVVGSVDNNKPLLTISATEDLTQRGIHAGQLVREAAKLMQGGGGGQPHYATAGGKNPDGLQAAIDKVMELAKL